MLEIEVKEIGDEVQITRYGVEYSAWKTNHEKDGKITYTETMGRKNTLGLKIEKDKIDQSLLRLLLHP